MRLNNLFIFLFISTALHAAVLYLHFNLKPIAPQFSVDSNHGHTEVELIAHLEEHTSAIHQAAVQAVSEDAFIAATQKAKPKVKKQHPVLKSAAPAQESAAENSLPAFSTPSTARSEAKAIYFKNPAPRYPDSARRLKKEGTVELSVMINAEGLPEKVTIFKTSGYPPLDRAAQEAVEQWKFKPATLAGLAIATEIVVPIKFELNRHE